VQSNVGSLANRFSRSGPAVVALLAIVGLSVSLIVLILPEAGDTLPDRAQVSAAIAGIFALFAAIVAVSAGLWVTTSDYKAEQAVKQDIARLRSALRSIMSKGALLSQTGGPKSPSEHFKTELETVNTFLSSTSAFGFWTWVEERGRTTPSGTAEPWRVYFLGLGSLLMAEEIGGAVRWASDIESTLASLRSGDISRISSKMAHLTGVLGGAKESDDIILASVREVYGSEPMDTSDGSRAAATIAKFRHLKLKGIADPNVDMFLAVFDNDTDALQQAVEAGADLSVTDGSVLAAHEADLADFGRPAGDHTDK
jgi:hypothetical protein